MNHPGKYHPDHGRAIALHFLYPIIAFSLIALSCNTVNRGIGGPAGDSPGPGDSGLGGPTRPVGFVNHGSFIAVVMPWTFIPLGSDVPETPPDVSTVSTVPTTPGLWPNSSRFLSLPFGTYTWCFEWDEGDLDKDGYTDYFHFLDERPVTVDENDAEDPVLAVQVDFSAPPDGGMEILTGPCGADPVTVPGSSAAEVRLLPGNAGKFSTPPPVIVYANIEAEPPPAGVTVSDTCAGACWRNLGWVALLRPGHSLEAAGGHPTTAVGVQLWGDSNDGWARVLVDGMEVWSGNTYGPDADPFVRYLQVSGLPQGPHTIRVEHMGQKDVTVFFFGFGPASP